MPEIRDLSGLALKAGTAETDGAVAVYEGALPGHTSGPALHVHDREDEALYVIEGEATVQLQQGDTKVVGRGASTDVIEASARAYIDGLNKLSALRRRQDSAQQQMFVDHARP